MTLGVTRAAKYQTFCNPLASYHKNSYPACTCLVASIVCNNSEMERLMGSNII